MTEYFVYANTIHYRNCGSGCEAETYKYLIDRLLVITGDVDTGVVVNGCTHYTRSGDTVTDLWVNKATSALCSATVNGVTGNRTYTFSNYVADAADADLLGYQSWTCPAPSCNRVMDLVLVLDESGSISDSDWLKEIEFASNLIRKFTVNIDSVLVGVVFFDDDARVVSWLHYDAQSVINAMTSTPQGNGWTCIGCGLNTGMSVLYNSQYSNRPLNPARIMITLTDGGNNRPEGSYQTHLQTAAAAVHAAGVLSFAIGVGSAPQRAELELVASTIQGEEQVYSVSSFDQLNTIISNLVQITCQDLNPLPCGQGCYGFCTCAQTCACPKCPNVGRCLNNNCTTTGSSSSGCIQTPVNCNDNNACTTDYCLDVDGCHHDTVDCNDGEVCTLDSCSTTTGCIHRQDLCNDRNVCTRDYCVNGVGCQHEDLCEDNNACTADTCNNATGCSNTPITCDDGNACTQNLCDVSTGCDFTSPVNCNDNNVCTIDTCSTTLGCKHTPIDCEDGNICTSNPCDPITGCKSINITCTACAQYKPNCTDKVNHRCEDGYCVQDGPSGFKCNYTKWIDGPKCNSGNKCIIDSCDLITETCAHVPVTCAHVNCTDVVCNPATGLCDRTPRNCTSPDPCWIGSCVTATDTCRRTPFCPPENCKVVTCTVPGGVPTCTKVDLPCSSGTACIIDGCDVGTGLCTHVDRNCNDGDPCTIDSCDSVTGCRHVADLCDDGDPCTADSCVPNVGCRHPNKCDDGKFCTMDICNPKDAKCSYQPTQCKVDLTDEESGCFIANCTEQKLCFKQTSRNAFLDLCGNCIKTFGVNRSDWNTSAAKTKCIGSLTWPKFAATLTAAAIAGIIIAAIVGGAIVTVSGIFATKELIRRARLAADQAAHNNPLYKDDDRELQNPAFGGR